MYIHELPVGTQGTISFIYKEQDFDFATSIIEVTNKDIVVLDPITIKGQVLNLNGMSNIILTMNPEKSKPIEWRNVRIVKVKYKDKNMYAIASPSEGIEVNRRHAFRQPVCIAGEALLKESHSPTKVMIRDISLVGVSIVVDESLLDFVPESITEGFVHITFEDKPINYYLSLQCVVKRIERTENGKVIFGCKFLKEYLKLQQYINILQLKQKANNMAPADARTLRIQIKNNTRCRSFVE